MKCMHTAYSTVESLECRVVEFVLHTRTLMSIKFKLQSYQIWQFSYFEYISMMINDQFYTLNSSMDRATHSTVYSLHSTSLHTVLYACIAFYSMHLSKYIVCNFSQ